MIKNIADKVKNPKEWFLTLEGNSSIPSFVENLIRNILNGYSLCFYTEVSFKGLQFTKNFYPRFDFWLSDLNIIIEYDGEEFHKTEFQKEKDKLKDIFCKKII